MSGLAGARSTALAAIGLAVAGVAMVGLGTGGTSPEGPASTRSATTPPPSAWPASAGTASAGSVAANPLPSPVVKNTTCPSSLPGDVNGDGHAEAAIGEAYDEPGQTGAVHLYYGTNSGLVTDPIGTALDDEQVTQDSPGVPGMSEPGDSLGFSTLLAEFNGDDCSDLAIGVPGEGANTGRVVVLYGSEKGAGAAGIQWLDENRLFGSGSGRSDERFGHSLASGDLDGDGIGDLVVGAPGETVDESAQVGGVAVVYGAVTGLATGTRPSVLATQDSPGVPGAPQDGAGFGEAVAAGDINGDEVSDLIVGAPGESDFGSVQVLPGVAGRGLGARAGASYTQNTPGVPGDAEPGDRFGAALAAGDVTGDGSDDLAVGAPGEMSPDAGPRPRGLGGAGEGAVVLLPGSPLGLTGTSSQIWSQDSPGVWGVAGARDAFGASLAMAHLDNGPLADLAIGVPFDKIGQVSDAGSVNILVGRSTGLSVEGDGGARFHQDYPRITGSPETGDEFGRSVGGALAQSPEQANLLIGVPGEDLGAVNTGLVHQLRLFEAGPNSGGSRILTADTAGAKGMASGQDLFGLSVG